MLKRLTEIYIEAFSRRDIVSISSMLDEGFSLEDPMVKRIEGKSAALVYIKDIFDSCDSLNFRMKKIFTDGNTTLIEFILQIDGVQFSGVDIIDWKDGKMCELRAYQDPSSI